MGSYDYRQYDYVTPEEQRRGKPARHPVIVVGAGPVGLTAAIDLAAHGVANVVLDDESQVSVGSRAICWAKRTLEIWDRLGCARRMVDKGVTWKTGKVFYRDKLLYEFDLLPEPNHKHPAFINLQQYYAEEYLIDRAAELDGVELRWRNRVIEVEPGADAVRLAIETPDGRYHTECQYLIACDGARSTVRKLMGLGFEGRVFEDRFLIADVRMKADFPTERWFWYHPPFHSGPSALLHRQADDVFRIDFQLGPDVDAEEEAKPENVVPRLKKMLGEDMDFELEWISVYRFQARRLEKFRHGRVIFAGDSAHQLSPFGARGGNSGVQDAENLVWKLALVLQRRAPRALLDTYDDERVYAAEENLRVTSRTTEFMSAKTKTAQAFRDAALSLAETHPFARSLVNAGRLSVPTVLADSPLNTPDTDVFTGAMRPGAACADAPVRVMAGPGDDERDGGWLLDHLGGGFKLLYFFDGSDALLASSRAAMERFAAGDIPVETIAVIRADHDRRDPTLSGLRVLLDVEAVAAQRYDARAGTVYLVRPDSHVAARWRWFDEAKVRKALARATRTGGAARGAGQRPLAQVT